MAYRDDDEDLQMALRMSLEGGSSPPEAKRSKPREIAAAAAGHESEEVRSRRMQRELMAAAAEKRMRAATAERKEEKGKEVAPPSPTATAMVVDERKKAAVCADSSSGSGWNFGSGEELPLAVAKDLFEIVFGSMVTKDVLAQWSNQGIRFSSDPETNMGLVQHEGGPCGVLATIQAYVLKYLLFFPDDLDDLELNSRLYTPGQQSFSQRAYATTGFASLTEEKKQRALVHSMVEILFLCGSGRRAIIALLDVSNATNGHDGNQNEMIVKVLEGMSVESSADLQKILRINTCTSRKAAFDCLVANIPSFQNRLGAMLFLVSALLSRGLEVIQTDRDDPSQPLVTAPFGHASQEIVNLLLCGEAVPNVFDGQMDLGGGMFLKGIPSEVEIGFLTFLESLNLCRVGQCLKCPKWPIWVVGSESHYTVLFALDPAVQEENELGEREMKIRRAFDAQDQSGGGGFINVDGFQQVLGAMNINFPSDKVNSLCSTGFIVWSEFWQALLELDKDLGGLNDPSGLMGKKQFDIFHFNGIAKSVSSGNTSAEGGALVQRPRLCKLTVVVPPRWTQEEYLADVVTASTSEVTSKNDGLFSLGQPQQSSQQAPLVDCIRTRWPRATCSWVGDVPSIV